mgnify:CR=1 FL=1|tara:strand:+ start:76391 stop:77284 length:894 start_codon:yes stop_codon:yes gene_type:complete
MDILITGSSGLLASRLIKELISTNHKIFYSTRSKTIDKLPHIDIFEPDINILAERLFNIDYIIHTAAMPYKDCLKNPYEAINLNSIITARLGIAAKNANIKGFIYFSTLRVFKDIVEPYKYESLEPDNFDFYANTKFCGERFLNSIFEHNKKNLNILRLANICCAPTSISEKHRQTAFNDICYQAIRNKKILIRSNKYMKRDFVPFHILKNKVNQIISEEIENTSSISFVSSNQLTTICALSERIAKAYEKLFGVKIPIEFSCESNNNQIKYDNKQINRDIFDFEIEKSLRFYHEKI